MSVRYFARHVRKNRGESLCQGLRLHAVPRWYQTGIIQAMGMTLRPSEQQAEALRRQAAAEGRSMQAVALSAIDEYIARRAHKAKVAGALRRVVREEAGVLERLKDA